MEECNATTQRASSMKEVLSRQEHTMNAAPLVNSRAYLNHNPIFNSYSQNKETLVYSADGGNSAIVTREDRPTSFSSKGNAVYNYNFRSSKTIRDHQHSSNNISMGA